MIGDSHQNSEVELCIVSLELWLRYIYIYTVTCFTCLYIRNCLALTLAFLFIGFFFMSRDKRRKNGIIHHQVYFRFGGPKRAEWFHFRIVLRCMSRTCSVCVTQYISFFFLKLVHMWLKIRKFSGAHYYSRHLLEDDDTIWVFRFGLHIYPKACSWFILRTTNHGYASSLSVRNPFVSIQAISVVSKMQRKKYGRNAKCGWRCAVNINM